MTSPIFSHIFFVFIYSCFVTSPIFSPIFFCVFFCVLPLFSLYFPFFYPIFLSPIFFTYFLCFTPFFTIFYPILSLFLTMFYPFFLPLFFVIFYPFFPLESVLFFTQKTTGTEDYIDLLMVLYKVTVICVSVLFSEMDVIVDELRENGINIDRATLSYFINKIYYDYQNVYSSVSGKLTYEDLFTVWERTHPETFGHVMAFLTTVHFQTLTDEQKRNVVRITVPILRNISLAEYRRESALDNYTLVRNVVHRYICVGTTPMLRSVMLLWRMVSYGVRAIRNAFT